jgi:hypothetical protein
LVYKSIYMRMNMLSFWCTLFVILDNAFKFPCY